MAHTIYKNKSGTGDYRYNGIDRIDNTIGYTETNIVGDFIDWVAYDIRLRAWATDLYNAYVNLNNNLRDYLINSLGDSRVSNYLQEQPYIL